MRVGISSSFGALIPIASGPYSVSKQARRSGLAKSFAGPLGLCPEDQLDPEKHRGNRKQAYRERSRPDGGVVVSDLPSSKGESGDETDASNPAAKGGSDLAARCKLRTIHNQ